MVTLASSSASSASSATRALRRGPSPHLHRRTNAAHAHDALAQDGERRARPRRVLRAPRDDGGGRVRARRPRSRAIVAPSPVRAVDADAGTGGRLPGVTRERVRGRFFPRGEGMHLPHLSVLCLVAAIAVRVLVVTRGQEERHVSISLSSSRISCLARVPRPRPVARVRARDPRTHAAPRARVRARHVRDARGGARRGRGGLAPAERGAHRAGMARANEHPNRVLRRLVRRFVVGTEDLVVVLQGARASRAGGPTRWTTWWTSCAGPRRSSRVRRRTPRARRSSPRCARAEHGRRGARAVASLSRVQRRPPAPPRAERVLVPRVHRGARRGPPPVGGAHDRLAGRAGAERAAPRAHARPARVRRADRGRDDRHRRGTRGRARDRARGGGDRGRADGHEKITKVRFHAPRARASPRAISARPRRCRRTRRA